MFGGPKRKKTEPIGENVDNFTKSKNFSTCNDRESILHIRM